MWLCAYSDDVVYARIEYASFPHIVKQFPEQSRPKTAPLRLKRNRRRKVAGERFGRIVMIIVAGITFYGDADILAESPYTIKSCYMLRIATEYR